MNDFYTNIAGNLFTTNSDVFRNYYQSKGSKSNQFHLSPITPDFVFKELCALNPTKSTGLDGIPARFLRDGAIVLKDHLTHIINMSIHYIYVPTDFKFARVKPLYKKNDRSEAGNHRQVC